MQRLFFAGEGDDVQTKPFLALAQSTGEGAHRSSLGKQGQSNRATCDKTRAADKPPVLLSLPHQE